MTTATTLTDKLQTLAKRGATEGERAAAHRTLARIRARQHRPTEPYRYAFEGDKYRATKTLTALEVAVMIREDIKVARKVARQARLHGAELAVVDPIAALPKEARVTVRRTWATHTSVITITVRGLTGARWWRRARGFVARDGFRSEYNEPRYFPALALTDVGQALEELATAYNFDDSDTQSDYFHRRFFLDVKALAPGETYPDDIGGHKGRYYRNQVREWIGEEAVPA